MANEKPFPTLLIDPEDPSDASTNLSALTDSDANSVADSISNLINLDNISAHNLYLGAELRKLGGEGESEAEEELTSCGSSRPGSVVNGLESTSNIDYSALDRFGFIVLGDREDHEKDSEEDREFRKKQ